MPCCVKKPKAAKEAAKEVGDQVKEHVEKQADAALNSSAANFDALETPKPQTAKKPAQRVVEEVKKAVEEELPERKPLIPAYSNSEMIEQDLGGIDVVPVEELDECVGRDSGNDAAEAVKRERAIAREAAAKAAEAAEGGEVASPKVRHKPKPRT